MYKNKKKTIKSRTVRRVGTILTAAVLSSAFVLPDVISSPETDQQYVVYADEKDDIKDIQYKNAQREKLKQKAQEQLSYLNVKATDIRDVIAQLDQSIAEYQVEIMGLVDDRNAIQAEIAVTESNLQLAYIAEANQYERMKERIAYAYENGDIQYIDALVALDDFSNLINQSEYVEQVSAYDQNQLNELLSIKKNIQEQESLLQQKLEEVREKKADTEAQQEALVITQDGKKAKLEEYNELIYSTNGEITTYQQLIDEGNYQIQRLEAEYRRKQEEAKREAARKKAAEEAAKKKAAEEAERKKREAENAKNQSQGGNSSGSSSGSSGSSSGSSGSSSGSSSSGGSSKSFDEVTPSGTWVWPCPASHHITSYFGYRTPPTAGATSYHQAIDVGCSVGTKVVAMSSGRVMYTAYSGARGNYIRIDHGGGITSLYQHLSGFAGYSAGDYVEAGTVIAYSGMTGICAGAHLHFEIWKNGYPVNPLNYVN